MRRRKSKPFPPEYSSADYDRIAEAIRKSPEDLAAYHQRFDAAAVWYRLNRRGTARFSPTLQKRKLQSIAKKARKLLEAMGINDPDEAEDGPARKWLSILAWVDRNEDAVLSATTKVGRLIEILEAADAAAEVERRARYSAKETSELGKEIVAEGHQGNRAINGWIAAMMGIYKAVSGKEPKTSVRAPEQQYDGVATGPFIRFLAAAAAPLDLSLREDAWRSRVRTILRS